jgi:hypothetical protein
MAVKTFSPAEALNARKAQVPDAAVEVLNEQLAMYYTPGSATKIIKPSLFAQFRAKVPSLSEALCHATVDTLNDNGWKVTYCVPGMHEEYEPYFNIVAVA